jgi:arginine repressor
MAVVIPLRFASAEPDRRDRIVRALKDGGIEVRRSTVDEDLGELYLIRARVPFEPVRRSVIELLERDVPGWQDDVEIYWPGER